MPSVSQDERQVVYISAKRPGHQQPQVYIYDLENLTERRITFQDGDCRDPLFVRGTQKIIYSSNTDELKENPILFEKALETPEGKAQAAAASMELYLSDISGSEIKRLTTRKGFDSSAWARPDKSASFIYSLAENGKFEAWQINIDQMIQFPLLKKKNISISSLRPTPAFKKWAWIERSQPDTSQIVSSIGRAPGGKETILKLPPGDYQDLSWLDEDRILFSAKMTIKEKMSSYYQLYSFDLRNSCLEKIFDSSSNLKSPQYLKNNQTLIFVSDLSNTWQIYNKALPASSGQCLEIQAL